MSFTYKSIGKQRKEAPVMKQVPLQKLHLVTTGYCNLLLAILCSNFAQSADAVCAEMLGDRSTLLQYFYFLDVEIPTASSRLFGPRAVVAKLWPTFANFTSC